MKIESLRNALCLVMLAMLPAEQIGQAQEPVGGGTPPQTLFAYRSSFWARVHDPLLGYSVLPSDVPVELAPVDPFAFAHATINSAVTFRVVRDDVVGQYAYAYAGTLVQAKVTRIREGKLRIRRGKMEPRVMEVTAAELIETSPTPAPDSLTLRLESSPRSRFSRTAKQLATLPLTAIHMVVIVPAEWVLLVIACSMGCDL